ncbi:MAG: hypothetical protein A2X23_02470 [Chloroflexi bacterium GWC2_73_18]|nr:MAG: hypothetical protein A2X23_02470 [Chloroflexi bacterium GWC2_73_18]
MPPSPSSATGHSQGKSGTGSGTISSSPHRHFSPSSSTVSVPIAQTVRKRDESCRTVALQPGGWRSVRKPNGSA